MPNACDIFGQVFRDGPVTLLARVVGIDGQPIAPADVAALGYAVWLVDDDDADQRTAIEGHAGVALVVADVVLADLQLDASWTADSVGYNFRHTLDVGQHTAFPIAGRRYLVEYRLTPPEGQPIVVRFRLNAI